MMHGECRVNMIEPWQVKWPEDGDPLGPICIIFAQWVWASQRSAVQLSTWTGRVCDRRSVAAQLGQSPL